MKKLGGTIGITQGTEIIFEHFQDGGEMWIGTGKREVRKQVNFGETFNAEPSVQCSLTLWDADGETNLRVNLEAESITAEGFELVFRTWGNTKIARIGASWMAVGTVQNDDDWELI